MLLLYSIILFLTLSNITLLLLLFYTRKKEVATDEMQHRIIAELKMQTIRNRLSSHFFFNVLSGISGPSIESDNIRDHIKTLLMLFRKSVDNIEQLAIPLEEELEVLRGYLDLQRLKIPEPFKVTINLQEGINQKLPVLAMILQIPVENAIKHGLYPLPDEKILKIQIENYQRGVLILIEDNGIGYKSSFNRAAGTGTGLKILNQTIYWLNNRNKEKIEFTIEDKYSINPADKGTIVKIKIPENYSFKI